MPMLASISRPSSSHNSPKGLHCGRGRDRTVSGQGSTIIMENLLDLEGKAIDVISYGGSVRLSGENAGINQGFYTFRNGRGR